MTYWAIRGKNGRIAVDWRRKDAQGNISSTGGASGPWAETVMFANAASAYSGPLYRRKRDAQEMCWSGERPVRVAVIEAGVKRDG